MFLIFTVFSGRHFLFSLPAPSPLPLTRPISSSLREVSTWRFREQIARPKKTPTLQASLTVFFVSHERSARSKYEELTLAEFVAGYAQVLVCKDLSSLERTERKKHLVSLIYFAQQCEWSTVLNFHGSVLLEIERGLVQWGESYLYLESRTLYGHPLQGKSPSSSSSAPVLFCRDYQREQCISVKDHFGFIRGECKWLKHICAACWTRL